MLLLGASVGASMLLGGNALAATSCEDLKSLRAPDVTITESGIVASPNAVASTLPPDNGAGPFCRVAGVIAPTADSHIQFEVWLPANARWNGKLQTVGNGGLSGALNRKAMLPGFARGYATMTTDLGHTNTPPGFTADATWASGHPDKVIDYAYRGKHLSTLAAKQLVELYYGRAPAHSYFTGCSAGGIAGLNELLRYPDDYDGYVIGNATPDHLGQEIAAMWNTLAASLADPANALQPAQMDLVHREVLRQCAGKDGGVASDPFLTDPRQCAFRAADLQCKPGQDAASCLTEAQVAIFDKIYGGPTNPRTGASIFAGLTPGSELGWSKYFAGKKNPVSADRPWASFMRSIVYDDPDYLTGLKYLSFDFDADYRAVQEKMVGGETLASSWTADARDLTQFAAAGGKVIQYHGWDDPNIPALEAIDFRDEIVADLMARKHLTRAGAEAELQGYYRLFMVPGLGHCSGGDGPWSFGQNGQAPLEADAEHDTMRALELWVEGGKAPDRFIGSRIDAKTKAVDMTRPICAYPQVATWNGQGSSSDAANFRCAAPVKSAGGERDLGR